MNKKLHNIIFYAGYRPVTKSYLWSAIENSKVYFIDEISNSSHVADGLLLTMLGNKTFNIAFIQRLIALSLNAPISRKIVSMIQRTPLGNGLYITKHCLSSIKNKIPSHGRK